VLVSVTAAFRERSIGVATSLTPLTRRTARSRPASAASNSARTVFSVSIPAAGRASSDVSRVEINEAFASVAGNSTKMLGVDEEIVNVNGGAIALGHPIGASGGRIVTTMINELSRNGGGLGLAAICSGGGQGDALLLEVSRD